MHWKNFISSWLDQAIEVAHQGGSVLKTYWGKVEHIKEKEYGGDLVTEADEQSERMITASLQRLFPSHQILAEEAHQKVSIKETEFLWVVDPLDGTTNYAHQYPIVAVSLGLLHYGEPILGVVYNPIQEELYRAAKGKGAFRNGTAIQVSNVQSLSSSLLATGFAYDRRQTLDNNYKEFCYFTDQSQGVRRGGAASLDLAYVACGRLDGYWERGLKPWDMAAGIVLVTEAGGLVSDYDQATIRLESGRILATNRWLHQPMSQALMQLR